MSVTTSVAAEERLAAIRAIVAEVLEIEPSEMTEHSRFREDHEADSLRAIEILARLEKHFGLEIPQNDLARMTTLANVYAVVKQLAGWED